MIVETNHAPIDATKITNAPNASVTPQGNHVDANKAFVNQLVEAMDLTPAQKEYFTNALLHTLNFLCSKYGSFTCADFVTNAAPQLSHIILARIFDEWAQRLLTSNILAMETNSFFDDNDPVNATTAYRLRP